MLPITHLSNYSARMKSMSVKELKINGDEETLQYSSPSSPFGNVTLKFLCRQPSSFRACPVSQVSSVSQVGIRRKVSRYCYCRCDSSRRQMSLFSFILH